MKLPKISNISLFLASIVGILVLLYTTALVSIIHSGSWLVIPLQVLMVTAAALLSFQGIFTLFWMLFGWENPKKMQEDSRPSVLVPPSKSFTLLVPARFEAEVVDNTARALEALQYPKKLIEVLFLCRSDDTETIAAVTRALKKQRLTNGRVLVFDSDVASKPSALNVGLRHATHDIVGVFDAEDEPNKHIIDVVNTIFVTQRPSIVQGGVQLLNYQTNWYSVLNVLEYYFWYRSALHLFSKMKVVPLGGNTVFFDKKILQAAGGWKECLTEDAEIGLRLTQQGEQVRVVYDARIATAEESPATVEALLKQRTRWNQGFLQIFLSKEWLGFSELRRRMFAGYFLLLAQFNALNFLLVVGAIFTLFIDMPVAAALVVLFPSYLLGLQLVTQLLGYYEFSKEFKQPFSVVACFRIIIGFIPYQMLLALAAFRAVLRHLKAEENWEKTPHENLHRLSMS